MRIVNLKKGLDLNLRGASQKVGRDTVRPECVALVPDDFPGFTPRPAVKEGDTVVAGQPILTDKVFPEMALTSPVSGTVEAIVRGERRKLLRVVVKCESIDTSAPRKFDLSNSATPEGIRSLMLESGIWALMRQRPYDIVPAADSLPRDIMVTAFDSAPLALDIAAAVSDRKAQIEAGLKALSKLTKGKVYVGLRPENADLVSDNIASNVEAVGFTGRHPAGNAGVQLAAIAPVNKGDIVWTMDITVVARLGNLLLSGTMDYSTMVAVTGSDILTPETITTIIGADVKTLLNGRILMSDHHQRIISGNVLTGVKIDGDGYLRFPYHQLTVIPEGDDVDEFMGWASNSLDKMSESRSFLSHFFRRKSYAPDARINGGRRAMIMSGQYDDVMPMDIMTEYLVKAVLAKDIDRMEQLGIYEVAPEDFALCEYIDPSKLEIQKTIREGLDYVHKELS